MVLAARQKPTYEPREGDAAPTALRHDADNTAAARGRSLTEPAPAEPRPATACDSPESRLSTEAPPDKEGHGALEEVDGAAATPEEEPSTDERDSGESPAPVEAEAWTRIPARRRKQKPPSSEEAPPSTVPARAPVVQSPLPPLRKGRGGRAGIAGSTGASPPTSPQGNGRGRGGKGVQAPGLPGSRPEAR